MKNTKEIRLFNTKSGESKAGKLTYYSQGNDYYVILNFNGKIFSAISPD